MGEPDKHIGSLPEDSSSSPQSHECSHQGHTDSMHTTLYEGSLLYPVHGHCQNTADTPNTPATTPYNHDVVLSSNTIPTSPPSPNNSPTSDPSTRNDMPGEPDTSPHTGVSPSASQSLQTEPGEIIVEEVVDEMPLDNNDEESTRTFVISADPTTQPLVQEENVPIQSYAEQLAAALRMKTSELSWLFIEAEGRLALAREWTEEAREAGETNWARYMKDIDILESALQDVRSMLDTACNYS